MTLVDAFTVLGAAVVLPWAVPAFGRAGWTVCAAAAAVALLLPTGALAMVVAAPWLVVAGVVLARAAVAWLGDRRWTLDSLVGVAAPGFATVAGAALVQSCLGRPAFGVHEPIIQLTAVHFTFAGAGGVALAGAVHRQTLGRARCLAAGAVLLTAGAPPVVAVGFLTHAALPQVGGAVLMTMGVWCTAVAQLGHLTTRAVVVRGLLVASSLAVAIAMPLGVAWAAAQHWGAVPALSVPDMARTHGMLNGVVFVPCGLLAWRLADRAPRAAAVPR